MTIMTPEQAKELKAIGEKVERILLYATELEKFRGANTGAPPAVPTD